MKRLLIANRGEIAVRIIRACREAGISPIAVYSDADRSALHVALADSAFLIGAAPASESYLRMDAILEAARRAQADAIHPGYGFLSENAAFAEACRKRGITFVGPPPEAIRLLGDKIAAKNRAAAAGVPVVPGYNGEDQSDARLRSEAAGVGFPLLIKAAAGGGGRGMRLVREPDAFSGQLEEARREALAAFGDDRVLLEHYVENPRHIEFQIFGDTQGNLVHLFERECSIQRRHQKIIEESPSPILTPELRARMADAAVKAGRAAGYCNAGTVEFLLQERPDGDHAFYFLEVNTRLQVEHPVTEMLTGLDLVRWQFRVASGEPLPLRQEQITARGHVIEARLYAEDASAGFLPSVGALSQWIEPRGPGVRVDAGVEWGSIVSPYYDPMLAKLIVSGEDRAAAVARLEQALIDFAALGVRTNLPYLLAIVRHPAFRAGQTSTAFLSTHFARWEPEADLPVPVLLALAGDALTRNAKTATSAGGQAVERFDPWNSTTKWRNASG